ncbi:MAG TPA: hypothetical protein VMZ53_24720 [Kofleriaceae bacterium]|nr:hypothetical protein [Kofleriaceae bacterium]
MRAGWAVSVVALAACGGPHSGSPDADANGSDADGMVDGGDGWKMLIQRPWTVGSASEQFRCRRQTITEDMYITGLRALAPTGTHHTLLTIPDVQGTNGNFDCTPNEISGTPQLLFGGGIGTNDFLFPPGVAVKIPAGTQLQLYLHIYNASDATMNDTSGILVKTVPASEVVNEADMFFVGKRTFQIPPDATPADPPAPYSITTDCGNGTLGDWHVVGMWPHMHQHASHQKVEITRANVTMKTPLDVAFDFKEQRNYAMDYVVPPNDRIAVTCTWLNDTGSMLYSGDNFGNEMCYAGLFVYPKVGNLYGCVNN